MFLVDRGNFVYGYNGGISECRFDAIIDDNQRWIVVFTELQGNLGPSITNAMESLINQFCKQNMLKFPEEVDIIERYETAPNCLDVVKFNQFGTTWVRIGDDE